MIKTQEQLNNEIISMVKAQFPVKGHNGYEIDIKQIDIKPPTGVGSIQGEYDLKVNEKSLFGSLRVSFTLKKDGKVMDSSNMHKILDVPYKSLRGTYIINGTEKVVSNQLRSISGPYTKIKDENEVNTTVSFPNFNVPRIDMSFSKSGGIFKVSIGGKNFSGYNFLKFIGASDQEIRSAVGNDEYGDMAISKSKSGGTGTLSDLYSIIINKKYGTKSYPGEAKAIKEIQDVLANNIINDEKVLDVISVNIGHKEKSFDKSAVLLSVKKMFEVARGTKEEDDRDDLIFQQALSGDDLILEKIERDIPKIAEAASAVVAKGEMSRIVRMFDNFGKSLNVFLTKGQLVENIAETNPLQVLDNANKVTVMGEGGLNQRQLNTKIRNLKVTGMNRIDPVHSPESGKIGAVNYLAQGAEIDNGVILAPFYKMTNGEASNSDSNVVRLTPRQEYDSYVAFYDKNYIEEKDGKISFKKNVSEVPARFNGKPIRVPINKIQYLDKSSQNIFAIPTNLIPFGHHNDGNRMLMGGNMQTQAINLINREEPMVQVLSDDNKKTYEEIVGEQSFTVKAPVDGTITSVNDKDIKIKDNSGKEHTVEIYNYFPLNMGNYLNNEPTVKVGDTVKKDSLIAEGWDTRNGKLALGLNTRIGYMPFKGYNFEDGIVVSESFSQRASSEDIYTRDVTIYDDHIGGFGSNAKKLLKEHIGPVKSLDKLDDDGIIKVGSEISPGDIIVARLKAIDLNQMSQSSSLIAKLTGIDKEYRDASDYIPSTGYTKGKVIRVEQRPSSKGKQDIRVLIAQVSSLKPGDKLAGRHGNKGTVTKIVPDSDMPKTEDGKPLELIFSPLAIPSRKNPGQLLEVNAGLLAEKKGKPYKVSNFSPDSKEKVLNELKDIGLPDGKVALIDPETGKTYDNPVTVGNMYVMRLMQKADDKIQARNMGNSAPQLTYMEPMKQINSPVGEKENPQKLGEMEMWAYQGHGAVHNILEATTLKGDGAGDRAQRSDIFRFLSGEKTKDDLKNYNSTPESLRIFKNYLTAMNADVVPMKNGRVKSINDSFSEVLIKPAKDKELVKSFGELNKVTSSNTHRGKMVDGKDKPFEGGLFDPEIFGDDYDKDSRNKWGYIELTTPVPNPLILSSPSYNSYAILTGFKAADLKNIMSDKYVLITNPGDSGLGLHAVVSTTAKLPGIGKTIDELEVEDGKLIEYKAGGDALEYLLKRVDLDKKYKETKKMLKSTSGKDRDDLYKKYRILKNLKDNNMRPEDLVTKIVPVVPTFMRPRRQSGSRIEMDDMNDLYSKVIEANNSVKNTLGESEFQLSSTLSKDNATLYKTITDLYGVTKYTDPKSGAIKKGFKDIIGHKEGLIHNRMLSKKIDYSGRSVIGVDPTLGMDEVVLPYDMARDMYKPFIIKELVRTGKAKNHADAESMLKNNSPTVKKTTIKVVQDRPVILNRAPSLHALSVQAFNPIVKEFDELGNPIRSIQLNPLVTGGFNADFDGDQMGVHVPLTDKAVEEARTKMMPSQNLVSFKNGDLNVDLKHEMLLGLYYLTIKADSPTSETSLKTYSSYGDLHQDWKMKNIGVRDLATLDGKTATVGQLLANFTIPNKFAQYRNFKKVMDKKYVKNLFQKLHTDKSVSTADIVSMVNAFKDLGFESATKSAMSIGINDFKKPEDLEGRIEDVVKKIDDQVDKDESKLIAAFRDLETKIEDEYKSGKILEPDNPVQIMMASGARGNSEQIRRISGVVGVGRDVLGNQTLPVTKSHIDGLSPKEFWLHSYDSRKGMYDRVVSTSEPGAFTKEMMAGTQDMIITENDCKTSNGTKIAKTNKTIMGRFATIDIKDFKGIAIVRAGEHITKFAFDKISADDSIDYVWVRSPMTCKTVKGICQKCYGYMPNTNRLPELGRAVGVIATQSMGEPLSQGTMNTFHGGAAVSKATLGLPRIKEILSADKDPSNKAILAKGSGIVRIETQPNKAIVYVDKVPHTIGIGQDGKVKPLRVKDGDFVNKGDFLTTGDSSDIYKTWNLTNASPQEIFQLSIDQGNDKALDKTRDYMANTLEYAFANTVGDGTIDRRHLELAVNRATSKVKITDSGNSPYMPGQVIEKNEADRWNSDNINSFTTDKVSVNNTKRIIGSQAQKSYGNTVKKGDKITENMLGQLILSGVKNVEVSKKPVEYVPEVMGVKSAITAGNENWLSNAGYQDVGTQLARGLAYGQKDDLSSIRSRQMTGNLLPIGSGFNLLKTFKDKANSFKESLINMFD